MRNDAISERKKRLKCVVMRYESVVVEMKRKKS